MFNRHRSTAYGFRRIVAALLTLCVTAFAQVQTPKVGSPERKALMDALRLPVEKQLKKKVVFKVDHLKVQGDWAFLTGVPQQANGKAMDYRNTPYQALIDDGVFDNWICALLRKEHGKWQVLTFQIGATDVPWVGWSEEYKAPAAIFQ